MSGFEVSYSSSSRKLSHKKKNEGIKIEVQFKVLNTETPEVVIGIAKGGHLPNVACDDLFGLSVYDAVIPCIETSDMALLSEPALLDHAMDHAKRAEFANIPHPTNLTTCIPTSSLYYSGSTFPIILKPCQVSFKRLEVEETLTKLRLEQIAVGNSRNPETKLAQTALKRKNNKDTEEAEQKKRNIMLSYPSKSNESKLDKRVEVKVSLQDEEKSVSKNEDTEQTKRKMVNKLRFLSKREKLVEVTVLPQEENKSSSKNEDIEQTERKKVNKLRFPSKLERRVEVTVSPPEENKSVSKNEDREQTERKKVNELRFPSKLKRRVEVTVSPQKEKKSVSKNEDREQTERKKVKRFPSKLDRRVEVTVSPQSQEEKKSGSKNGKTSPATLENDNSSKNTMGKEKSKRKGNETPTFSGTTNLNRSLNPPILSSGIKSELNHNQNQQYSISARDGRIHKSSSSASKLVLSNPKLACLNPAKDAGRKLPPIPKISKAERTEKNGDKSESTSSLGSGLEVIVVAKSALERPVFSERMQYRNDGKKSTKNVTEVNRVELNRLPSQPNGLQHIETEVEFDFNVFNNCSAKGRGQGRREHVNTVNNVNNTSVQTFIPALKSNNEPCEVKMGVSTSLETNIEQNLDHLDSDNSDTVELNLQRLEDPQAQIQKDKELDDLFFLEEMNLSREKEIEVKKLKEELSFGALTSRTDEQFAKEKLIIKSFHILPPECKEKNTDGQSLDDLELEIKLQKNQFESALPVKATRITSPKKTVIIGESQKATGSNPISKNESSHVVSSGQGLQKGKSKIFFRPRFHDEELDYDCEGGVNVTDLDLTHIFSSESRIDNEKKLVNDMSDVVVKAEGEDESSDEDCDVLQLEPDYVDEIDDFLL